MRLDIGYRCRICLLLCWMLITGTGCNYVASCSNCEGCSTITTRLIANDSIIHEQQICTAHIGSQAFQDSVQTIIISQQSRSTVVSRHDTSFNCQHESPKTRDAGIYEAAGWYCQYPK